MFYKYSESFALSLTHSSYCNFSILINSTPYSLILILAGRRRVPLQPGREQDGVGQDRPPRGRRHIHRGQGP